MTSIKGENLEQKCDRPSHNVHGVGGVLLPLSSSITSIPQTKQNARNLPSFHGSAVSYLSPSPILPGHTVHREHDRLLIIIPCVPYQNVPMYQAAAALSNQRNAGHSALCDAYSPFVCQSHTNKGHIQVQSGATSNGFSSGTVWSPIDLIYQASHPNTKHPPKMPCYCLPTEIGNVDEYHRTQDMAHLTYMESDTQAFSEYNTLMRTYLKYHQNASPQGLTGLEHQVQLANLSASQLSIGDSFHLPPPTFESEETKRQASVLRKEPLKKPSRPLTAYNLFFKDQRISIIKAIHDEADKSKGPTFGLESLKQKTRKGKKGLKKIQPVLRKIPMEELSKKVSSRWKTLPLDLKMHYQNLAKQEKSKYDVLLDDYRRTVFEEREETQKRLVHSVDEEIRRRYFAGDAIPRNARR